MYEINITVWKKRNPDRFPKDFMFEMTGKEIEGMVSHFVIPSESYFGGAVPCCRKDVHYFIKAGFTNNPCKISLFAFRVLRNAKLFLMSNHRHNLTRIKVVYNALGHLQDQVVFVGGATVSLYVDAVAEKVRPVQTYHCQDLSF